METSLGILVLNSSAIWALLCQTEALLSLALLMTHYKYISGIDDKFFSIFICMLNISFSLGSQCILFFLRILGSDELLIGVTNPNNEEVGICNFYVLTIGVFFVVFCASSLIILRQKIITFRKGKIFVDSLPRNYQSAA